MLNRTSAVDAATKWRQGACYELASVSEHETHVLDSLTTCTLSAPSSAAASAAATTTAAVAASNREYHLYQSTTHSVELRLAAGSPAHRRLGRFLIKYEGTRRMRVDLSPRLGGHTVANQPPPLLSSSHSPSFFPRNGVRSHSRCGTES